MSGDLRVRNHDVGRQELETVSTTFGPGFSEQAPERKTVPNFKAMTQQRLTEMTSTSRPVNPHIAAERPFMLSTESAESAPKKEGVSTNLPPGGAMADSVSQ